MAETADEHVGSEQPPPKNPFSAAMRSSTSNPSLLFKYYIHDRTAHCRLQLIGTLTEAEIPELDGCWRTAKTTLGNRQFILDLRSLSSFDDAGRRWLSAMTAEGASCLPETFLRDALAGKVSLQPAAKTAPKPGLFGRLIALFRGIGIAAAE